MDNFINRYKPPLYNDNVTIDDIYKIQSKEIKELNGDIKTVIDNTFVSTADINGIRKFEDLLEMHNNDDFTLEERRANVLNRVYFTPPFTRQKLNQILYNIYGQGGYTFEIYPDIFQVIIDINTSNPILYLAFAKDVRDIIPANMELIYAIQYTYLYMKRYFKNHKDIMDKKLTYGQLSQYSKNEIKE